MSKEEFWKLAEKTWYVYVEASPYIIISYIVISIIT